MTVCCEHNPCPGRPRWFLSRFEHRPWMCRQCGRLWVTEERYLWGEPSGWEWMELAIAEEVKP